VVEGVDLRAMSQSYRGSGSASYHPTVLLGLLVYGYATGVFSSRKLERVTYDSVAFRFIARERAPRPRHHRHVPASVSEADRGAVRRGSEAGA
jgi:transposase